jgi:hypothetical protein
MNVPDNPNGAFPIPRGFVPDTPMDQRILLELSTGYGFSDDAILGQRS